MMKQLGLLLVLLLLITPLVSAQFTEPDVGDTGQFDEILKPISKIYVFLKYTSTVVAALVMLIAGVMTIMAGGDPVLRQQSKNVLLYAVIGLGIIWAVPLVVNFLVA